MLRFFDWAFRNGDSITEELVFITLPDSTKNKIRRMWAAKFNFRSDRPEEPRLTRRPVGQDLPFAARAM